jgi:hypothetical protein
MSNTTQYPGKIVIKWMYERRRDRIDHPDGHSDGKRWYPSDDEKCDCCRGIRSPSAAYPWSYMVHCRTRSHCTELYNKNPEQYQKQYHNAIIKRLAIAA